MASDIEADKAAPRDGPGTPRRTGHGFRQAGADGRRTLGTAAARRGFAETDVLLRWEEIAGPALAARCHPVKVTYGRGLSLGATLLLHAEGAVALEVEHLAPRIIERINAHYGYRAISRIRVSQVGGTPTPGTPTPGIATPGAAPGLAEAQAPFAGPPSPPAWRGVPRPEAPVAPAARARAEELTGGIRNPGLRDALSRMGAYVLSRPPRNGQG